MKILQINNYHYLKGGSDRVYLETSRLLEEKGNKVIHFSVNDKEALRSPYKEYFVEPADYFKGSFAKKIINAGKFIYSKEAKKKLELLIKREKLDIAHLHIFYGRLTSSILPVLKKYNIPTVMTVHEYRMLCPVYLLLNRKGQICEKCTNKNYFYSIINRCNKGNALYSIVSALECYYRDFFYPYEQCIDKFIMVSKFIYEKHLQYMPILKDKAVQIYNFINIEDFTPTYVIGDYYLYFGRLSREKGILTLLDAWKHFPELRLKIVGDGAQKGDIMNFIKKNNLNNIDFAGFLSGIDLINTIKKASFVIVPSEWFETFGLNIIEGFACGKPVITSKIGAITELVQEGNNGFLFENKDVNSLVQKIRLSASMTDAAYITMSHNARAYAETHFNKEIYYQKLLGVYKKLI